jgi:AmiR/NasT family two-component response regulator
MLCLLADPRDRSVVSQICERHHWNVFFVSERQDAARLLGRVEPQVMLFDREITEDWRPAMTVFGRTSRACIILVSKVIDDGLWTEVVRHGGYEVLPKPLDAEDVLRAVKMARSYWSSANRGAAATK